MSDRRVVILYQTGGTLVFRDLREGFP